MERKERYGRFVLTHQEGASSAGSFHRAVEIGPGGYERHVQLFRSIPLPPEILQATADGLKLGAQVAHAQIPRAFEAGRLETTAFVAAELVEGRSVAALIERSRRDAHPFAVDHALLIASKAAAALEAAQAKRRIHGFLLPEFIQVSWDGEVTVRAFGLNPRVLLANGVVSEREAAYLAPEVGAGAGLDIRCDVFSLGAQLFEMLTGAALPRGVAAASSLRAARTPVHGGDGGPLPAALVSLLAQALAEDPAARYRDAASFKKAVDTLLFSGDYSPTTFNLAFFMHTLFRDEGDAEAAKIKAERAFDYRTVAEGVGPAPASVALVAPRPAPSTPPPPVPSSSSPEPPRPEASRSVKTIPPAAPAPVPEAPLFSSAATSETRRPNLVPVIAVVVVLLAGGGYVLTRSGGGGAPVAPPQPTMNPAETAALARVRELESRLAALEAEKMAAEQQAVDEAKRKLEAQAKARGREVDPVELQRAQEAARLKAQADQDARLAVERQKIEDEKRRADEARAAEAARSAEPAPAAPVATPASTPAMAAPVAPVAPPASAPSTTAAATSAPPAPATVETAPAPAPNAGASSLLDLSDPGVVPPQLVSQPRLEYPPVARAQRVTGTVVVSALVDEQGSVVEARVIRGVASNTGLNQAALDSVRKRKYKPATLNGKPGRTWVAIQIDFKL